MGSRNSGPGGLCGAGVTLLRALARLLSFDLSIAARRGGRKLVDQPAGGGGGLVDGAVEDLVVGARRTTRAAQFADELHGRGADLRVRGGWLKIGQGFDASAHAG